MASRAQRSQQTLRAPRILTEEAVRRPLQPTPSTVSIDVL